MEQLQELEREFDAREKYFLKTGKNFDDLSPTEKTQLVEAENGVAKN